MVYVICNNDEMLAATLDEAVANAEVRRLKASQTDERFYYHYHEVRMLDASGRSDNSGSSLNLREIETKYLAACWHEEDRERRLLFGVLVMPFGKYQGTTLNDVPLKYLDETISVMPPTYFVRSSQQFVSACMEKWYVLDWMSMNVPDKSRNELNGTTKKTKRHENGEGA